MPLSIKNILKEYVRGLVEVIGINLNKMILYGSYAKGTQNQDGEISDLDIMIIVNCEECEINKLQKMVLDYSFEYDIKYNILLSPIVENANNYNKKVQYMEFYKKVEREGVLISA